jgi:hypothetical protein
VNPSMGASRKTSMFFTILTTAGMQEVERSRMPEPKTSPHPSRLRRDAVPFMQNDHGSGQPLRLRRATRSARS